MDVVKTNIERIGGTVDVHSTPGEGTTVKVKIPLTLAIIPALIVTSAADSASPSRKSACWSWSAWKASRRAKRVEMIHGAPVYRLRGQLLPLVHLSGCSRSKAWRRPVAEAPKERRSRARQHCRAAGRRPAIRAGGGRDHRYRGNRRQAARQAPQEHQCVCRRDHHGRWQGGPDSRRARPGPARRTWLPRCGTARLAEASAGAERRTREQTPARCFYCEPARAAHGDPDLRGGAAGGVPGDSRSSRRATRRWCNTAARSCRCIRAGRKISARGSRDARPRQRAACRWSWSTGGRAAASDWWSTASATSWRRRHASDREPARHGMLGSAVIQHRSPTCWTCRASSARPILAAGPAN